MQKNYLLRPNKALFSHKFEENPYFTNSFIRTVDDVSHFEA